MTYHPNAMDDTPKLTLIITENVFQQLQEKHAEFQEITKDEFNNIQRCTGSLVQLRRFIYRTLDMELENGDSKVIFYNLCYVKRKAHTKYFAATVQFIIPPSHFLGDYEEQRIIHWFTRDKGHFLRGQYNTSTPTKYQVSTMGPRRLTLSEEEQHEVDACIAIFKQEGEFDWTDEKSSEDYDIDLPCFDLQFDFLKYDSK